MIRVTETFRDREILLVGANGFIGKVLLALLLERFPEIRRIYFLIRPKTGGSPEDRFARTVLASPPLQAVLSEIGLERVTEKVVVLAGDISLPDCGLSEMDLLPLVDRISLIVNCAGLVEFTPPVDDSVNANATGVENVVALARRTGAALLHVSTCFVCGVSDGLVEETEPILGFYPYRKGPGDHSFNHERELAHCREQIRRIYDSDPASQHGGHRSKEAAHRLTELGKQRAGLWGWVNTYTYSKSLGEQIIAAEPGLRYAIVRPAIVEAAVRFPFPGWVEGGRTAAPLVLMAMSGLRHWTVRRDAPLELVPVDLVANGIVIIAAALLNNVHRPVYHLSTADVNPLPLGELIDLLWAEYLRTANGNALGRLNRLTPFRGPKAISGRQLSQRRERVERRIGAVRSAISAVRRGLRGTGLPDYRFLNQWSTALRILGLQLLFRHEMLELYQPFTLENRFIFEADNIRQGYQLIAPDERHLIPWDPEAINWRKYWVENEIQGIKKWVEPESAKHYSFKM